MRRVPLTSRRCVCCIAAASRRQVEEKDKFVEKLQKTLASVEEVAREKAEASSKRLHQQLKAKGEEVAKLQADAADASAKHAMQSHARWMLKSPGSVGARCTTAQFAVHCVCACCCRHAAEVEKLRAANSAVR